ncbi:MAG TPA: HEAT repeat domain-containing protein [Vicinamibacteria bacterium]|nr:HEAT repeat domain-containing protein [Vicinamibacteria bacterium]
MRTGLVVAVAVAAAMVPRAGAQAATTEQAHGLQQEQRERAQEQIEREQERRARAASRGDREEELYERGREALDEERWDRAVQAFDDVARMGGRRADAGLYWKAYGQRKAGRSAEALATLAQLRKTAPRSRWLKEADALEQEIRQASGQPPAPERQADEDLKLIAINALMSSDAEQAVPMLEKLLAGGASPKLRNRALFVLTQSGSPRGRALVADIARGKSHLDLQRTAVKYLGLFGGEESRTILSEIYASGADVDVKKAVLQAFMTSGDKARVLAAARSETSPELRRAAIRQLGPMGAQDELWELYKSETSADSRKDIIQALFVGGGSDRIAELARTESDPELRRNAVRTLGLMGSERTGPALVSLYQSDKDPRVRREALHGLFIQGNARALVQLGRSEKDPELRKEIVRQLSLMGGNKDAMEFLMEILQK